MEDSEHIRPTEENSGEHGPDAEGIGSETERARRHREHAEKSAHRRARREKDPLLLQRKQKWTWKLIAGRALVVLLLLVVVVVTIVKLCDERHFVDTFYEVEDPMISNHMRIVLLTDLHLKEFGENNHELVEEIRELKPDIIAMAGDMIDMSETDYSVVLTLCEQLVDVAPVYFSYGNHEKEVIRVTQTSTVNAATCAFWHRLGVKRVVLARELSLSEIRLIREHVPETLELEAFVHGAMCVSYSGRCLLSNYYVNRNANEGFCAQPCRWKYYLSEEKKPGEILSAEQREDGTYLFSSKDLCMIEHVPELCEAGLDSLKIEGRVKSAYYAAAVTNAYRMAADAWAEGKPFDPAWREETESVSHREYVTGYFFSSPSEDAQIVSDNLYLNDRAFLAVVHSFDPETGLAFCEQYNKMRVGDEVNLLSPGTTGRNLTVTALLDAENQPIPDTRHPRMRFYLPVGHAAPGDIIRGV